MSVVTQFILTEAEKIAISAYDHPELQLGGRLIDGSTPGVGVNLNDNAADYDAGEVVQLAGNYVVAKAVVDNAEYKALTPLMVAALLEKPFCMLENETIFAPFEI